MQIPLPARRTVIIRRRDTQGRQGRIETGRGVCALPPRYITKPSIPRACLARFIRELHYFFFAFFFFFFPFFPFFSFLPRSTRFHGAIVDFPWRLDSANRSVKTRHQRNAIIWKRKRASLVRFPPIRYRNHGKITSFKRAELVTRSSKRMILIRNVSDTRNKL